MEAKKQSNDPSLRPTKWLVVVAVVVIFGVFIVWLVLSFASEPIKENAEGVDLSTTTADVSGGIQATSSTEVTGNLKTYRNNKWGFAFDYPADWEIREPAFYSKVSLFNLAVEPTQNNAVRAVSININSNSWTEKALGQIEADGFVSEQKIIAGISAVYFMSTYEWEAANYIFPIDHLHKMSIAGRIEYLDVFNQIVASFRLLESE